MPDRRKRRLPAPEQRIVVVILVGAILLTASIALAQLVLSIQAPYPIGTPGFRTFWGLPFGWLRRTILAPPPTMSSPSFPVTVYDIDFLFFLLDVIFWAVVIGSIVLIRQGGFRRRIDA